MKENIKVTIQLPDEERQPCEVWTRVMGYFRPRDNFNIGKISEFAERKWFTEEKINDHEARNTGTK